MSKIIFKENVKAINQQIGDNNNLIVNGPNQIIEINWNLLDEEVNRLIPLATSSNDKVLLKNLNDIITDKNHTSLISFIKGSLFKFSTDVVSKLATNALLEMIKALI